MAMTMLVLCVVLLLTTAATAQQSVVVSNDYELYAALQDHGLAVLLIDRSISIDIYAWPRKVVVNRNVTIQASPLSRSPPLLDFKYLGGRVQLGAGVHLSIHGVFLSGQAFMGYTPFSAPGLGIMVPSDASMDDALRPRVVIRDSGLVYSLCPPFQMVRYMVRSAQMVCDVSCF